MTKELNIEIELGDLFSGGNQFKELRKIVKIMKAPVVDGVA